jgi:hypothetical protein
MKLVSCIVGAGSGRGNILAECGALYVAKTLLRLEYVLTSRRFLSGSQNAHRLHEAYKTTQLQETHFYARNCASMAE